MRDNPVDEPIKTIAEYVYAPPKFSEEAYETAKYALFDSLGCALLALNFPDCVKRLGSLFSETPSIGARVPGTSLILNPILAAFNTGLLIRWLDYNDTWLAAEWGHPSDNLGSILSLSDLYEGTVKDVLDAMIKAYEIQGVLALSNSFNRCGFDHVILVKIASTAVAADILTHDKEKIIHALTNAFIDSGPLRTYRHAPNAGPRKSWAAGDAAARGVQLAYLSRNDEPGYPSVLTTPEWGFNDVILKGKPLTITRPLKDYVMENILFKISFPAEFHAQTAVEAAIRLHPLVKDRIDEIERIDIESHESAMRIIVKEGPLSNFADRDHCLQYMAAIGLLKGALTADDYSDESAKNPLIDTLRKKMHVRENKQFTKDYLDRDKRSIANSLQIEFKDGAKTEKILIEYPLGHKRRREESISQIYEKFEKNFKTRQNLLQNFDILASLFHKKEECEEMPFRKFMGLFIP